MTKSFNEKLINMLKTDLRKISDLKVEHVQHMLNNRPRKLLNFMTPYEVFNHLSYRTNSCTY